MSREELFKAINNGNLEKVKHLVESGADIEETDCCEFTALLEAVYHNHLDVAKFLVEKGANINTKTKIGKTILRIAVYNNNLEMVKLLVESGVDIETKNNNKQTALNMAIKEEKTEIEEYLKSIELGQKGLMEDKIATKPIIIKEIMSHDEYAEHLEKFGYNFRELEKNLTHYFGDKLKLFDDLCLRKMLDAIYGIIDIYETSTNVYILDNKVIVKSIITHKPTGNYLTTAISKDFFQYIEIESLQTINYRQLIKGVYFRNYQSLLNR